MIDAMLEDAEWNRRQPVGVTFLHGQMVVRARTAGADDSADGGKTASATEAGDILFEGPVSNSQVFAVNRITWRFVLQPDPQDPDMLLVFDGIMACRSLSLYRPDLGDVPGTGPAPGKLAWRGWTVAALRASGFTALIVLLLISISEVAFWMVPERWFDRIGAQIVDRLAPEDTRCRSDIAETALNRVIEQIQAAMGDSGALPLHVVRDPVVNAAAIPGNQMFLFEGLIDVVTGPDALIGVLAHEIGHIHLHHVNRRLVRNMFLTQLYAVVSGYVGYPFFVSAFSMAADSRDAETDADSYAIRAMTALGVDPKGLMQFHQWTGDRRFARKHAGDIWSVMLASHPQSSSRARRLQQLDVTKGPSLISAYEWRAIQTMCHTDPEP